MHGHIKEPMQDFSTGDVVPAAFLDRLQADDVLLSQALAELATGYLLPKIHTADHKMAATTAPDTFTLEAGAAFTVAGVRFVTEARTFTVPDNATRYLRAEVAEDCGELETWYADPVDQTVADPLVRRRTVTLYLSSVSAPSSPTSMRIAQAVKGAAGTHPVLTFYANAGEPLALVEHGDAAHAHAAAHISYNNAAAALPGNPATVQAALDALDARLDAVTLPGGELAQRPAATSAEAIAGVINTKDITPQTLKAAFDAWGGGTERPAASSAEAIAGTLTTKDITPKALRDAFDAWGGGTQRPVASPDEAIAGVINTKDITPATLRAALDKRDGLPWQLAAWPTVCASNNRVPVTAVAGAGGGRVTVAAGTKIHLNQLEGDLFIPRILATPDWDSGTLDVNSLYFVRAHVAADGALLVYICKGADGDVMPGSAVGTPGGDAGGGFDSTRLDALLARVQTGAAGTVPAVKQYSNANRIIASYNIPGGTMAVSAANVSSLTKTISLSFGRTPRVRLVGFQCQVTATNEETEPTISISATRDVATIISHCSSSDGLYRDMPVQFAIEA